MCFNPAVHLTVLIRKASPDLVVLLVASWTSCIFQGHPSSLQVSVDSAFQGNVVHHRIVKVACKFTDTHAYTLKIDAS